MTSQPSLRVRIPGTAVALLGLTLGCGDDPSPVGEAGREPARIELDVPPTMTFGDVATAQAVVYDGRDEILPGAAVHWETSSAAVAQVTSDGRVSATGAGAVILTARSGDASAESALEVLPRVWALDRAGTGPASAYTVVRLVAPPDAPRLTGPVEAELDGGTVPAAAAVVPGPGDTLAVFIPDVGTGTRTLRFAFDANQTAQATIETVAAPPVDDPDVVIDSVVSVLSSAIDSVLAEAEGDLAREDLIGAQALLGDFSSRVASMTAEERSQLAAFLATNPRVMDAFGAPSHTAVIDPRLRMPGTDPITHAKAYVIQLIEAIGMATALVLGLEQLVAACVEAGPLRVLCATAAIGTAAVVVLRFYGVLDGIEAVTDDAFKPYEEMVADVSFGTGSAPGTRSTPASLDFYPGTPVDFEVSQRYATLTLSDRNLATGVIGEFLHLLADVVSGWTDVRLLLEQVARDLGGREDVSLRGVVPEFPQPRATRIIDIPAASLEFGVPDNTAVSCAVGGESTLQLTCTSQSTEPETFSIEGSYPSDFGTQRLVIDGTLQPSALSVTIISGDGQEAYPGDPLPEPLVVRVWNLEQDAPAAGVTVEWDVLDGDGILHESASTTDADGHASVTWTVGTEGTEHAVTAVAMDGGTPAGSVVFTATSARGTNLALVSGDGQSGEAGETLAEPLVVRVHDHRLEPIAGVEVAWTIEDDGGSLSHQNTTTDASGETSVTWTRGSAESGLVTASVTVDGEHVDGSPVTFVATPFEYALQLFEAREWDDATEQWVFRPSRTVRNGDALTLPRFVRHRLVLLLDGDSVLSHGSNGQYAFSRSFGGPPESAQDSVAEPYTLEYYDADNGRYATITLQRFTLDHSAYRTVVGRSFSTHLRGHYGYDTEGSTLRFNEDGTVDALDPQSGATRESSSYFWYDASTPHAQRCETYDMSRPIVGAVRIDGGIELQNPNRLTHMNVYADGTVGVANHNSTGMACVDDPDPPLVAEIRAQ